MKPRTYVAAAVLIGAAILYSCSSKRNPSSQMNAASPSPMVSEVSEPAESRPAMEPVKTAPGSYPSASGKTCRVTITGVHQESELSSRNYSSGLSSGFPSDNSTTYQPKPGYTFLVLDLSIRKLDGEKKLKVSSDDASIIGADGRVIKANGSGSEFTSTSSFGKGKDYCVGCQTKIETTSEELSISLVFTLKENSLHQPFKLRFSGVPLIPFSISKQTPTIR